MIAASTAGGLVLLIAWRFRPRPARVVGAVAVDGTAGRSRWRSRSWRWRWRRHRARRPDAAEIGEWCGRLSASCRSGATLSAAVRSVAPPESVGPVVAELQLALQRGAPLTTAIDERAAGEHLDIALTVMRACAASGAPAAEPLDRAAAALRARAAEAADRTTHSAQARLSAVVMTFLPVAMLVVLLATSGPIRAAVATPVGISCVVAGALLNLAGWRWMQRIIDRAAR